MRMLDISLKSDRASHHGPDLRLFTTNLLAVLRGPELPHDVLVREVPVGVEEVALDQVVVDLILPGD